MGSLPNPVVVVVVEDLFGILKLYSDGSIYRSTEIELNFPDHDDGTISWNDYLFDVDNTLYLRLYKPPSSSYSTKTIKKLPVVYFFHGGGFCLGSRTWPNHHNCCLRLSSALNAFVIAPDYRLAPEDRLPAALEDSFNSLKWLQAQVSTTMEISGCGCGVGAFDFDRVFVIGDSSGGNLAYQLAVRLGPGSLELAPVRVRGYVLIAPFFGGVEKTKSEVEGRPEPVLNSELLDRFWRLSLPDGHNLDDPQSNPFGPKSPNLEDVSLDPILVMVGGNEVMKDRIQQFATQLTLLGKDICYIEYEGKHHGFFTDDAFSEFADDVLREIQRFICR